MNPFSAIWLALKNIFNLLKGEIPKDNYSKVIQDLLYAFFVIAIVLCLLVLFKINFDLSTIGKDLKFYVPSGILVLLWLILIIIAIFRISKFRIHNLCGECSYFKIISHINSHIEAGCDATEKYINGLFRSAGDHNQFINEVQKHAKLDDAGLNLIRNDIAKSVCGRFLCVVSNQDYLTGTKEEIEDMFGYFLSMHSSTQKNYIARVFCIPATTNVNIKYSKLKSIYKENSHNNNIILFQYLLINQIAGVSTYLQVHKEGKHLFFPNIDYVLASPLSLRTTDNNGNEGFNCENRLYFSYTRNEVDEEDIEGIIYTKDSCLVKIFENEFYYRLPNEEYINSNFQTNMFPATKSDEVYEQIQKVLRLKKDDVNSCISTIVDYIKRSDEIKSKDMFLHKLSQYKI